MIQGSCPPPFKLPKHIQNDAFPMQKILISGWSSASAIHSSTLLGSPGVPGQSIDESINLNSSQDDKKQSISANSRIENNWQTGQLSSKQQDIRSSTVPFNSSVTGKGKVH